MAMTQPYGTRPADLRLEAMETADSPLHVEREDIRFYNVSPNRVRIEIGVRNDGSFPSRPTTATIEAAPLGAFLPWQPLVTLPVPALIPGQRITLSTEVSTATSSSLGDFFGLPPSRPLATASSDDRDLPFRGGFDVPPPEFRNRRSRSSSRFPEPAPAGPLPPDPLQAIARGSVHWAGNLNVFIGRKAVERHRAQALRVYPGVVNVAMFFVGRGSDAYRFSLTGDASPWDAALHARRDGLSLLTSTESGSQIRESEWIEADQLRMLFLTVCPPHECRQGELHVYVEQRSTGEKAVVEFSLDPEAAGPGCYTL